MSVAGIIVVSITGCFVLWLIIDTIISFVKKAKLKKKEKEFKSDNKAE